MVSGQELKDLVKRILVLNPTQRLGAMKNGAADVKEHPWYSGFDWTAFAHRVMPAPYVPKVTTLVEMSRESAALLGLVLVSAHNLQAIGAGQEPRGRFQLHRAASGCWERHRSSQIPVHWLLRRLLTCMPMVQGALLLGRAPISWRSQFPAFDGSAETGVHCQKLLLKPNLS